MQYNPISEQISHAPKPGCGLLLGGQKKANVIVWYSWKLHGHLSGAQQTVAFQWRVFFGAISV